MTKVSKDAYLIKSIIIFLVFMDVSEAKCYNQLN